MLHKGSLAEDGNILNWQGTDKDTPGIDPLPSAISLFLSNENKAKECFFVFSFNLK